MIFTQHADAGLSQFSYLIGDETTGRAVVVDPARDVTAYLAEARSNGLVIESVIETHVHADFCSGHLELAARGARIYFGEGAELSFPAELLADRERLHLGEVTLEVRATPGHTPESISILVFEREGDEHPACVLTGDALFVGDVGRPDLLASTGRSAESLARDLYASLHEVLLRLPQETRVYPAHGAGSACGRHLDPATSSTIGRERLTNRALGAEDEAGFVRELLEDQLPAPAYFAHAAHMNRAPHQVAPGCGAPVVALRLDEALAVRARGGVVIDTRSPEVFATAHLAGSLNVSVAGRFAEQCGALVEPGSEIVLVGDPTEVPEARRALLAIGFDQVVGRLEDLEGALARSPELVEASTRLQAEDFAEWRVADRALQLIDVRSPAEFAGGTIPGARNIPLTTLATRLSELDPGRTTVLFCAGGNRSSAAASLLRSRGFHTVADLIGGLAAWMASALSTCEPAADRSFATPAQLVDA
jgi:glyoxylase-like metal-dependent hydrolase (beta-lactamase superfamily II)/rhodanese-related sulfurtransferase